MEGAPMRTRLLSSLSWLASLLACALAAPAHAADGKAGVDVQLRLAGPDELEVSYSLPEACGSIDFAKNGRDGTAMRRAWQPLDACGSAGGDRLARHDPGCPVLRFRVPAATEQAGYPAAFPLGQGLYAHLSNYALGDSCGKVSYRLAAPWIAANGQAYQGTAGARGEDSSVLLLETAPAGTAFGTPGYFDPRLSPAALAQIRQVADGTIAYLRRALPHAAFHPPMLAASLASGPGGPRIGGDAGDVLRLSLYNWPRDPGPDEHAQLTLLVAHEFSHRFQLRDAVDSYPDARLIHEGGGEFLRWMTSVHEGWMTPAQAAADLDRALATCMLYSDGQAWRALSPRQIGVNRLEYACGLATYVYGLAARQGPGTALARVDGFYAALAGGARPDFAQALDCGMAPAARCTSGWIGRVLGGEGPMIDQWAALLGAGGLASLAPLTQAQRDAMVLRALVKLMKDDCGGASGTMPVPDGVVLDGFKACKTFTRDAYVTTIEGLPIAGHAGTGAAMTAACSARHQVALGLKDGGTLAVPCSAPYAMRSAFWHADIEKILAALARE
jgi:hypothetical protein